MDTFRQTAGPWDVDMAKEVRLYFPFEIVSTACILVILGRHIFFFKIMVLMLNLSMSLSILSSVRRPYEQSSAWIISAAPYTAQTYQQTDSWSVSTASGYCNK